MSRRGARVLSVAAVAAAMAIPGDGHAAATAGRYGIDIQAVFTRAGTPLVVANFSNGRVKAAWSICRPPHTEICAPAHRRVFLQPGRLPAGTVLQATATYRGRTYVARTARWRGTVHATARPSVSGDARVGGTVGPVAGRWSGGWPHDFTFHRIEACRTAGARRCVTLMDTDPMHPGPHRRVTVPVAYAGRYLFAFDERLARDTAFAEPGYGRPGDIPPLRTSRTVVRSARGVVVTG